MYAHWKGFFYPKDIPNEEMLIFYADNFLTVEVNNTFYRLPKIETVKKWFHRTPNQFLFAIKANRYITHMKKLKDAQEPLERLINKIEILDQKLGPILFQLPPNWHVNKERLKEFIKVLPSGYQYVVELRHESWYTQEIYDILKKYNIALCFHDITGKKTPQIVTADLIYIRFHGPMGYYQGKYSNSELNWWAKRINDWSKKNFVIYVYFNNDAYGYAIENAFELKNLLDI